MSSFTKLSNGNVIFTDNDGHEAKLSPTLNVLPNPENENEIIITPFARFTSWSSIDMVVDWREIQSPIVESRNDAIEKLALNFFFNVTQGEEQHSHSNLLILEKISEIDGELAYNGLKFGQVGNVIFVSASNGNNETGKRGSVNFPFRSLYSAFLVANPGDLIYVLPGTYNDENNGLLKDKVDFYFSHSTFVISNDSIFNDFTTYEITSNIFGYGNFHSRSSIVNIQNKSKIFLECLSLESDTLNGPIYVGSNLASIKITCESISGPNPISINRCLEVYVKCRNIIVKNSINTSGYAVFTSDSNTGIVDVEADIIQGDTVYGSNVINHLNGTLNIRCKSITDDKTTGNITGGIIYHKAGKLSFQGNITVKGSYIYTQKANTGPVKVVLSGTFISDTACIAYLINTTDIDFLGKFYSENSEYLISIADKINQKVYCEGVFENKSLTGSIFRNTQDTTQIVFSKCTLKAVAKIINSTVSITIKVIDFISLSKAFESNISVLSDYITLIPGFQLPVMPSIKHGKIVVNDSADKQNTVISFGSSFATSNYTLFFRVYDASQEYIVDEVSRNTTGFVIDLSTITFTSLTVEFFAAL